MTPQEKQREAIRKKAAQKQGNTKAASNKSTEANAKQESETKPARVMPTPDTVKVYYSTSDKACYAMNQQGEYQSWDGRGLNALLRSKGFDDKSYLPNGLSFLDAEYLRILFEQSVHYAGPLGGYKAGIYTNCGNRILVTKSPKFIEGKAGQWRLLRSFLGQLFGNESIYVLAWIKAALDSVEAGEPWTPGQLLAVAGPPDCGKSVFQSLLTPILGGRISSPYPYMSGQTNFNAEIYGAEHGLIGDEQHKHDRDSRRAFGAAIKRMCVNPEQYIHGKHRGALTLNAFIRLSLTLNDNPHALLVLPELDSDVADKIILVQATPVKFPFPSKEYPSKHDYSEALKAELPAMVHHLRKWTIPDDITNRRYGVISYKSPGLIQKMQSLSVEWKLWNLIEMYMWNGDVTECWTGTAVDLEKDLRNRAKNQKLDWLFFYPGACGAMLTTLSASMPEEIIVSKSKGRANTYTIVRK